MLEFLLFLLALAMIWIAWGFWAFLAALAAKVFLVWIFKPKYRFDVSWGPLLANLGIVVVGIFAVYTKWHEPVYTAAAVVIAVILYALELKG